ncbi:MAG: MoxR family ATPase [Candidatus Rifleibacteriota bacterium]
MKDYDHREKIAQFKSALQKVIIGKPKQITNTIVCLIANGHLLLEDMPGVGKTTLASALARLIGGDFSRIQFTADLLPSDVVGTKIYRREKEDFEFVKGPIFANVVLADELNRAPPKTQSALLQAMNEYAVSVDKQLLAMSVPFMVIATQNPRGFHGTYPLPESQRDRFLMRLSLGYPDADSEKEILKMNWGKEKKHILEPLFSLEDIVRLQDKASEVPVPEHVYVYVTRLTAAIRNHAEVDLPVSPRGSIGLVRAAQALALLNCEECVSIDNVKEIAPAVLCHRIGLKGSTGFSAEGAPLSWLKHEILQRVEID